jgi:aminopeptidase N
VVGFAPGAGLSTMPGMPPKPFCPPDTPLRWIRPRQVDIHHIDLEITVDVDARTITGAVTHHCRALPHGPAVHTLELDQHGLDIASVEVDGSTVAFSTAPDRLDIAMPTLAKDRDTCVRIAFSAREPRLGMFFIAAKSASADPCHAPAQVAMAWTQGAMEDHSHWFPCFDSPNQMSTFTVAIRHRSGLTALANGERVGLTIHGDGWTTTTYAQRKAHVLYLLNVVVGDLAPSEDAGAPVPVTHWLPRGTESCAPAMFRATAHGIRWLADYTGTPYPWARYGHAVAHGFMWGGMENTTLTTITDRVIMDAATQVREDVDCDSLVVHELVHQWYGDLMTMKSWSDIWLNESFATYLEARGTAAWEAPRLHEREADRVDWHLWANRDSYLEEDGSRYRRALVTNRWIDAYELFDRVAYEKGSLVLHHLSQVLGEERFRNALALYTRRHAGDLVESGDFRQALEDGTGEPLDWFTAQWLDRPGHPELKVRWRHDPGRKQLIVTVEQTQAASDVHLVYRLPTAIAWRETDGALIRHVIELTHATDTLVFPCAANPRWLVVDPDGHLPAVWDEDGDAAQLVARIGDAELGAQARARAAVVAGKQHPVAALVDGVAALARDASAPELVRQECLNALGELRGSYARDALLTLWSQIPSPRLRRVLAGALAKFRGDALVAERLVAFADALIVERGSLLTAGACLAARGAVEVHGATAILRGRLHRPSWQQRLRQQVVRGLGDSGEAAAIDDVLPLAADVREIEGVRAAACVAVGRLGGLHVLARPRIRLVLERLLDDEAMQVRAAAAKALAMLGDPAGKSAIAARLEREALGNIRRVLRENLETLGQTAAITTATAELTKRIDTLDSERKKLEQRLEALEKRLG